MTKEIFASLRAGDIVWFMPGEQTKLHGNKQLTVLFAPKDNDGWCTYTWRDDHLTDRRACTNDPKSFAEKVMR